MKYTNFTTNGASVSRLGFGSMGLNGIFGKHDDAYMIQSVLNCLEKGVTFIDTARAYGRSEEILGKALKEWKGQKPFIATKVKAQPTPPEYPGGAPFHYPLPVEVAYPKGSVTASLEESLKLLQTDYVDLLQMHQYWPTWDASDYWMEELIQLKEAGKILHIGVSLPDHRHDLGLQLVQNGHIDSIQTIINIFDSSALDALVPMCSKHDIAVIARVILDEGGLAGFLTEETIIPDSDYRYRYFDCIPRKLYIEKVNSLRRYIPEYADSLADLAIRFVLQNKGVTVALTSMQVHENANQNINSAAKAPLPEEIFNELAYKHRWIRNFYQARRYL